MFLRLLSLSSLQIRSFENYAIKTVNVMKCIFGVHSGQN